MAKESTFKSMTLTLLVITLLSAGSLGIVYTLTLEPIAAAKMAKVNSAIGMVLPQFDNNPSLEKIEKETGEGTLILYPATLNGEAVGTAVQTFSKNGFGGDIGLMVGFLADGTIYGIEVIEHKETPGLGDKIETKKSDFSVQFKGQNPREFQMIVKKDGGEVDAITASTISSRAYCDAVQRAYDALFKQGGVQ